MSKKLVNTLLIVVVTIIWVMVIYRFFFEKKEEANAHVTNEAFNPTSLPFTENDTLVLSLDYADPFLSLPADDAMLPVEPVEVKVKEDYVPTIPTQVIPIAKPIVPKRQPAIPWHVFSYKGRIQGKGKEAVLLQIKGKSHIFQLNEKYDSVTVLKITQDSVLIKYRDSINALHLYH